MAQARTSLRPPAKPGPPPSAGCTTCGGGKGKPQRTSSVGATGKVANGTASGKAHAWGATRGGDDDDNRVRVLGAQASGTATANRRGASAQGDVVVSGASLQGKKDLGRGNSVNGELDVLTAKANGRVGATRNPATGQLTGIGANGEASAAMARGKVGLTTTDRFGVQKTSEVEGKIMSADAKADFLLGDDGRRVGAAFGAKAGASAASVNTTQKVSIPIPFTSWSVDMTGNVELAAGDAAVGAGAYAYKDRADERYKAGVFGKIGAIFGVEVDREISIGPRGKK